MMMMKIQIKIRKINQLKLKMQSVNRKARNIVIPEKKGPSRVKL